MCRGCECSGHTPGHPAYLFGATGGPRLLVWGDTVHYHFAQFEWPDARYENDIDHAHAVQSRRALLQHSANRELCG